MKCVAAAVLATTLCATAAAADPEEVIDDINALNEALQILLTDPNESLTEALMQDPELVIGLSASNGLWSADGIELTNARLALPTDTVIAIQATSSDLFYEMSFPRLELTFTAIPGRIETFLIEFTEPGLYQGDCECCCAASGAPLVFDVQ